MASLETTLLGVTLSWLQLDDWMAYLANWKSLKYFRFEKTGFPLDNAQAIRFVQEAVQRVYLPMCRMPFPYFWLITACFPTPKIREKLVDPEKGLSGRSFSTLILSTMPRLLIFGITKITLVSPPNNSVKMRINYSQIAHTQLKSGNRRLSSVGLALGGFMCY